MRKYARQTNKRLLIGFILLLFIVGGGLIYVIYGEQAALLGVLCMGVLLAPLTFIWLLLQVMERISKKEE